MGHGEDLAAQLGQFFAFSSDAQPSDEANGDEDAPEDGNTAQSQDELPVYLKGRCVSLALSLLRLDTHPCSFVTQCTAASALP